MAQLQKKVFTWGSYAYKSVSNAYVLELTLTENSINPENNTSNISYALVLKSGSNNRFQCDVKSTLKLNGETVATDTSNKYLDFNSTWELLSGTADVEHNQDGSLNMPIEVTIDTTDSNKYAPPDKTLSWSWGLTIIPRASSITSAAAVTLGESCAVSWIPNSKAFRYKLRFSLEDWSYTTGAIHPNKTSAYTYTGYEIPLADVAQKITSSKTGEMTVELITYSDSDCKTVIGTDSDTFTVTVPENEDTKPDAEMLWEVVGGTNSSTYNGFALQWISRIEAFFMGIKAKYGATVVGYSITVQGSTYDAFSYDSNENRATILSGYLTKAGEFTVVGTVTDSRGISRAITAVISDVQVLPYHIPWFVNCKAYRCTTDGKEAVGGDCLWIDAKAVYACVGGNTCSLAMRYKTGNSDYTEQMLEANTEEDVEGDVCVYSGIVPNVVIDKENGYSIQVIARDNAGREAIMNLKIPCEAVFRHKRIGGKGVGYGGYCEADDLMDVHWNLRGRKGLLLGYGVGSVYISVVNESPESIIGGTWEPVTGNVPAGLFMWQCKETEQEE